MKFFRKTLKNGITLVVEQREIEVVSLSISNRYGAAYEDSSIKGMAHLIEHLVFTGTRSRTHEQISGEIEKRGGVLNAFTANEITSFLFKLPSEHVFVGLDILIDLLKNPKFPEEKFEKEKKVILEEIKMYHDSPERHVLDQLTLNLYEPPFGENIAGSEKTVAGIKREQVLEYFKKFYSDPSKLIVTAVGKVDVDELVKYLERVFEVSKERKDFSLPLIRLRNLISKEERAGIDQAHYVLGMHAPLFGSKEYYALELLDAYLASGMSSRLFLKIREEKGLAYTIQSILNAEKSYSYYAIYAGTKREVLEEVQQIILDEFKKAGRMSLEVLNGAKERVLGLRKISSEESMKVMQELIYAELAGNAKEYYQREKIYRNISLADIRIVSELMCKNFSSAVILPR